MANRYTSLEGGLSLEMPPIEARAGSCVEAINFYENVKGGYTTLLGYERFDGSAAPSTLSYYYIVMDDYTGPILEAIEPVVDGTITLGTLTVTVAAVEVSADGNTAVVIGKDATGTEPDIADFPLPYGGTTTIREVTLNGSGSTDWETGNSSTWFALVQDGPRGFINEVNGVGSVYGIAQNGDNVFAWRRQATNSVMQRQTDLNLWDNVEVAALYSVNISSAEEAQQGDVCNSGDITILSSEIYINDDGTVNPDRRIYVTKNNASGATPASLTRDSDSTDVGTVSNRVVWFPKGQSTNNSVQYINHNFYAGLGTYNTYFADGVNVAMSWEAEYDVVRPITANYRSLKERVTHVFAHNSRLFMATTGGTFLASVAGNPTLLDGTLDAVEIGVGDEITGFASTGSENLAIFTRNRTFGLTGTDPADWKLTMISPNSGARSGCIAQTEDVFSSDDRGIVQLSKTDRLGGFTAAATTDDIQALFNSINTEATCATTLRTLNQMRFYYGNRFLCLSRVPYNANGNEGIRYGITEGRYDVNVVCVSTEEDANGEERTFFGSDDGYVYQADSGLSADGGDMDFKLSLHFNHMGTPLIRKRYVGVDFEATVSAPTTFQVDYAMNDGQKEFEERVIGFSGTTERWDSGMFPSSVVPLVQPKMKLRGTGYNIQFSFTRSSSYEPQATLTGYSIRVKERSQVAL